MITSCERWLRERHWVTSSRNELPPNDIWFNQFGAAQRRAGTPPHWKEPMECFGHVRLGGGCGVDPGHIWEIIDLGMSVPVAGERVSAWTSTPTTQAQISLRRIDIGRTFNLWNQVVLPSWWFVARFSDFLYPLAFSAAVFVCLFGLFFPTSTSLVLSAFTLLTVSFQLTGNFVWLHCSYTNEWF